MVVIVLENVVTVAIEVDGTSLAVIEDVTGFAPPILITVTIGLLTVVGT